MTNLPPYQTPLTYEALMASIYDSNRYLTEKFAESDRLRIENEREIKEIFAESERQRKENERILNEKFAETDKMMKNLNKQLGGMGNSNGDVAESYFRNSFAKRMSFAGQKYESISQNLSRKVRKLNLQDEYDLVLYNCTSVVIIEIKYKADKDDIEDLLKKALTFKKLFPEYANFELYLGLAGFSVNKKVEKEAVKQGIAVIKQVGDTMVINDKNLKVF